MTLKTTINKKFEEISEEYIDDGSEPDLEQLVPVFAEGFIKYMREHIKEQRLNQAL